MSRVRSGAKQLEDGTCGVQHDNVIAEVEGGLGGGCFCIFRMIQDVN